MAQLTALPGGGPVLLPVAPGAVRRTMTLTVTPLRRTWASGQTVQARGRDVVRSAGGEIRSEGTEAFGFGLDEQGRMVALPAGPTIPEQLAGVVAQRGLRKVLAGFRADGAAEPGFSEGLRTELLDDVPGFLVASGYGRLFDGSLSEGPRDGRKGVIGGVCFGLNHLAAGTDEWSVQRFRSQVPGVEFTDGDPAVWHEDEPSEPVSVRRRRMLEVRPADGGVEIEGYFRDDYRGADGAQRIIHEYGLHARAVGHPLVLESITPRPGALPMEFCPLAVNNVAQLAGVVLDDVEVSVRRVLRGPAGCTHLNDEIRSLRMVGALLARLD
jgi:hypothetical protein